MNTQEALQALAQSQLFDGVNLRDLEFFVSSGTFKVYNPDDSIYHAGSANAKLIFILKGKIEISFVFSNPQRHEDLIRIPVELLGRHSLWGYTTLLEPGKQYPYHVHAREMQAEVLEFSVLKTLELAKRSSLGERSILYQLGRVQALRSRERQRTTALLIGVATVLMEQPAQQQLDEMIKLIALSFDAEKALFATFQDIPRTLKIVSDFGYYENLIGLQESLDKDTILSIVYTTKKPLSIAAADFKPEHRAMPYARPRLMVVPVLENSKLIGALLCAGKRSADFTDGEALALSAVSPSIGLAAHNSGRL